MKLRQDTDTSEATGTLSLATVDTATYIFQHLSRDTDTQSCLKQVRWDTLESTMSLLIPN